MKLQHNSSAESSEDLISLIIALWRRHKEEEEEEGREEASGGRRGEGDDKGSPSTRWCRCAPGGGPSAPLAGRPLDTLARVAESRRQRLGELCRGWGGGG